MAGLEVAKLSDAANPLPDVVAAQIQRLEKHPGGRHSKLCWLDTGEETLLQVVCTAPNLREGMRVPLARCSTSASDAHEAFADDVLCSAEKLGIGDEPEEVLDLGDDAVVGTDIVEYLKLEDKVFELDLTPNRADCFSLLGLAREVAAIRGYRLEIPCQRSIPGTRDGTLSVQVKEQQACPRYFVRAVRGLDPGAVTPLWLKERLRRSGVRALHPVVDVMNYVMLDLGQPLHAFDLDKIEGELVVRYATAGERIELIGKGQVELDEHTLLIADTRRPLALAGIAGGADSAVSSTTRNILIECAFFEPTAIAGRARSYGLHTEASLRFERGIDPQLQERAMERASELLDSIAGGEFESIASVAAPLKVKQPVTLHHDLVTRRLGIEIEADVISEMLTHLGCQVRSCRGGWRCTLPSHRFDLDIEEDLIEEVGRLYGYDKIGRNQVAVADRVHGRIEDGRKPRDDYRDRLVGRGYFEVMTYSFVDPALSSRFGSQPALELENPISPTASVMRASPWPGLLKVLVHNLHRQQERVRIFELGQCFDRQSERSVLGGLAYGDVYPEQWGEASRAIDFHDVKGDLYALLAGYSARLSCVASRRPGLHSGQAATIALDGNDIGCLGALSPTIAQQLGVAGDVFLFEIELDKLMPLEAVQASAMSRYPSVRRDISLWVPIGIDAADILACIDRLGIRSLQRVVLFDVYADKKRESGRKSITLGLIFQGISSTLEEQVCTDSVERVVTTLADRLKIRFRN